MLAIALVLAGGGCRETGSSLMQLSGQPVPFSITPRATSTTTGDTAVVMLLVDVRGSVGSIGSVTGALRYDPAALAYVSAVELGDAALRAANPGVGEVRVAIASASGLDVARLAAFRFIVRDRAALATLKFDLTEVHELSHANLQAHVQRGSASPFR